MSFLYYRYWIIIEHWKIEKYYNLKNIEIEYWKIIYWIIIYTETI